MTQSRQPFRTWSGNTRKTNKVGGWVLSLVQSNLKRIVKDLDNFRLYCTYGEPLLIK